MLVQLLTFFLGEFNRHDQLRDLSGTRRRKLDLAEEKRSHLNPPHSDNARINTPQIHYSAGVTEIFQRKLAWRSIPPGGTVHARAACWDPDGEHLTNYYCRRHARFPTTSGCLHQGDLRRLRRRRVQGMLRQEDLIRNS
jgi:hypothetical protein